MKDAHRSLQSGPGILLMHSFTGSLLLSHFHSPPSLFNQSRTRRHPSPSPSPFKPLRGPQGLSRPAWGPSSCPCRCLHKGMKAGGRGRERERRGEEEGEKSVQGRGGEKNCNSFSWLFFFFFFKNIRRKEKEGKKEPV